jgi:lipopolysaccharide transport system permease protein
MPFTSRIAAVHSSALGQRLDQSFELLWLLVMKDLKIRYKSSVLGYIWALANPLAFAFVYWLAFKLIMRVQVENYALYLITGLFPWVWLSAGIIQATRSFQNNSSLVKKVRLRRAILPLSTIVQEMIHFLFALPVIALFLILTGGFAVKLSWLWQIPVMVVIQLLFMYPLALIFALANVFVRDVEYLIGLGFSLLFFLTPMVYPVSMIPPQYRGYFELNPMHHLIAAWRGLFFEGTMLASGLVFTIVFAAVAWVVARFVYRRFEPRIGELL